MVYQVETKCTPWGCSMSVYQGGTHLGNQIYSFYLVGDRTDFYWQNGKGPMKIGEHIGLYDSVLAMKICKNHMDETINQLEKIVGRPIHRN